MVFNCTTSVRKISLEELPAYKEKIKAMADSVLGAIMGSENWDDPVLSASAIAVVAGVVASFSDDPEAVLDTIGRIARKTAEIERDQ